MFPTQAARWKKKDRSRRRERHARRPGGWRLWRNRQRALHAKDLPEQLARERDFAQEIARAERDLAEALEKQAAAGKSTSESGKFAARQRELAEETAALADVLDQIKTSATLEDRELAQAVAAAESLNPPREVAQAMGRNAEAIGSVKSEQAARDAGAAAERLEALAT